jgi:hypothetical protein
MKRYVDNDGERTKKTLFFGPWFGRWALSISWRRFHTKCSKCGGE